MSKAASASASALVAAGVLLHLGFARYSMTGMLLRLERHTAGVDFDAIFLTFPHMKRLYGLAGLTGNLRHTLTLFAVQCLGLLIHTFRRGVARRDCLFAAPAVVSQLLFLFYNSNLWRSPLGETLTGIVSADQSACTGLDGNPLDNG